MILMEYKGGKFRVLSDDQLYDIHMATLEVLEKTGVLVKHDEALQLLADAGASVDYESKRAHIPQFLVEEAVQKTPKTITHSITIFNSDEMNAWFNISKSTKATLNSKTTEIQIGFLFWDIS